MNTKEKAIAAVLFAVLLGLIFLWEGPEQETAPQGAGPDNVATGQGPNSDSQVAEPISPAPGDGTNAGTGSKPVEPITGAETTGTKTEISPPKPEVALLERFAELKPAPLCELSIDRSADDQDGGPLAVITIDPERGGIVEATLNDYLLELKKEPKMSLSVQDNDPAMLGISNASKTLKFSHAIIVEQTPAKLVIERQVKGTQVVVRQSWEVIQNSYRLNYQVTFINQGNEKAVLRDLRLNAGIMDPLLPPEGMFGASGIDQRIQYKEADDNDSNYERVATVSEFQAEPQDVGFLKRFFLGRKAISEYKVLEVNWLSIQNKFFTTSLFSEGNLKGMSFETPIYKPDGVSEEEAAKQKLYRLIGYANLPEASNLAPQSSVDKVYDFYIGPKNYNRLKSLRPGSIQEQIMGFDIFMAWHFGFMKYIALAIYHLLVFLYGMVGNFGWAIVLSTIVIRLLFSPITYKSSLWSQRMKEIQPEMAAIKEKYASDPQQMNMKVMELYRDRKVNPVGGCLPVFFQIPVFFALFNVLRSAIELRHAGFLFVADLSQPDMLFFLPDAIPLLGGTPFNILPLLMGGAMYLQQKLMPTSADPMQQKMMGFMSIFITFICYNMPSGLTLYWTVSNVCSIIQYKITSKMIDNRSVPTDT